MATYAVTILTSRKSFLNARYGVTSASGSTSSRMKIGVPLLPVALV